tara:strand:+ start:275 stop:505 length:231 start_codon:yes stop_codon:yes gene_type:complete
MAGTTIVKKTTLEERMFTLVSRTSLAITMFFLTTLWTKVDSLDQAGRLRDKELARFMLEIEHRMTALETKVDRRNR